MAGHAPKLHPDGRRLSDWLADLSDNALAMLLVAIAVGIGVFTFLLEVSYFS